MNPPSEGSLLGADWLTVRRRLGRGSCGVVYEAHDANRDCLVAVKTLPRFDASALLMLKQEFRTMADIVHPNLASLYDLVATDDSWFVTMELVTGTDLVTHLRSQLDVDGIDAIESIRGAFAQLATGVTALHRHGILHRDIKPSNVMVSNQDRVVLLDFGLAASFAVDELTDTDSMVGTLAYISPEQVSGHGLTQASDWYGVGAILFETLTGRRPFRGTAPEIIAGKLDEDFDLPGDSSGLDSELLSLSTALLRADPGARPTGEEVMAHLVRGRTRRRVPQSGPLERRLVGRDPHAARLRQVFDRVRDGEAAVVHVRGPSGVGKTTLVNQFVRSLADDAEAMVLRGRCYEQEAVPYKALDSLIDNLCEHLNAMPEGELERVVPGDAACLARVFPVLLGVPQIADIAEEGLRIPDETEVRNRARDALRAMLCAIAERHPTVVYIDDLHWGDADSAVFLEGLLCDSGAPRLLLVVSYRTAESEGSELLRRMFGWATGGRIAAPIDTIDVSDLGPTDSLVLARRMLRDERVEVTEDQIEEIARESEGNPFFLSELALHAASSRGGGPRETSLTAMIGARVAELPRGARELLEVVSLTGQPIELTVAMRAAGVGGSEDLVVALLRRGKLARTRRSADALELEAYHDRIRESVVERLSPGTLRKLHHRLAVAWESSGRSDLEALATHWIGAGERERGAGYAARAAEQAAQALAFERAAALYRQALGHWQWPETEERALLVRMGHALENAGRGAEAAHAYQRAARGAGAGEALALRRQAADQLLASGHIDEGLSQLRSVLAMVGLRLARGPRTAMVAMAMRRLQLSARGLGFRARDQAQVADAAATRIDTCWAVARGLIMVDSIQAAHFQSLNLLYSLRAGDRYRLARALAMEASASVLRGRRSRARTDRIVDLAIALAEQLRDPRLLGLVDVARGAVANFRGDFPRALELCRSAQSTLRGQCTGVVWEIDTAELYALHSLYWLGRWAELGRRVAAVRRETGARGDLYLATYVGVRAAHAVHLAADDPAAAQEEQDRSIAMWTGEGFQTQHYWDWFARVEIALYDGRAADAWSLLRKRWPMHVRSLLHRHQAIFIEAVAMRARVAIAMAATGADRPSRWLARARRDARAIEREDNPWGNYLARQIRAGTAITGGDVEDAERQLAAAENGFASLDMKVHRAVARLRRAALVGGAQGREDAASAVAHLAEEGVARPEALAAVLAPGRWP